jgi:hypothetical protein
MTAKPKTLDRVEVQRLILRARDARKHNAHKDCGHGNLLRAMANALEHKDQESNEFRSKVMDVAISLHDQVNLLSLTPDNADAVNCVRNLISALQREALT